MLQGEKVILRAVERDDLKRLHELNRNVELVVLGDDQWRPVPVASYKKASTSTSTTKTNRGL